MITNITQGVGIEVMGSTSPYPYVNMTNPSAGMVRYNGVNSSFEVYDGYSWCIINSSSMQVKLDEETLSILAWAKKKRNEEMELAALAEENSSVKDLMNQIKEKQEQLKVVTTLIKTNIQHDPV